MNNRTGNIRRLNTKRRYYVRRNDEERRKIMQQNVVRKILVTGSRDWSDITTVIETFKNYDKSVILVHGDCKGADIICAAVGETLGFEIRSYPADWDTYGKRAGIIRNQLMIDTENKPDEPIDVCIAFHDELENSKGTKHCVSSALAANIPVIYVKSKDHENED
jgi:hypothetical protein